MTRQLLIWAFFLTLTVAFTSCNGQVQTNLHKDNVSEPQTITNRQPKLVRTQGSDKYANVHCGLQDKAGHLWFGTTGEGIYRYDGKLFTQYTVKDGLSSNTVWAILEDNTGNIWFGTNNGICRYDGKEITRIPMPFKGTNFYPNSSLNNTLPAKIEVWSIMQDKSGKLWFATTDGVFCYNGKSFTRFLDNDSILYNSDLKINKVEYILEDKAGNFWFGGRGNAGVFRFDGKSLTSFKPDGENWAWPVLEDKNGNIWFSNWGGAYRYDGKSVTNFTKKESLCRNGNVTQIIEDKDGNLWFGSDSENGGICLYDGKAFTHFTTKDGLPNNAVWAILEDNTGKLWVGTRNTGLSSFDGKTFTNFSE